MAFHADFWVVAGTAAPVMLLAQIVVSGDALVAGAAAIGRRRVQKRQQIKLAARAYGLSSANLVLQGGMLIISLGSLDAERNLISTAVMPFFVLAGLTLLVLTTLDIAILKISQAPEAKPAKEPD